MEILLYSWKLAGDIVKFIHIADVHLGVEPDKGKPWSDQRAQEIKSSFERLLDVVKEENIDLLLIAGDLFHFPPTVAMLKELDARLCELENVTTILIAGNHDYRAAGTPLDRYEFQSDTLCLGTETPEQVQLEDLETCVTGISYHRQMITEALYDDLTPELPGQEFCPEYFHILLAHGGDEKHSPMNKDRMLSSGFDYIALGHIHKPEVLAADRMIYPGSLEPIDHTDVGARGYVIGEAVRKKEGWTCRTEWREFSCRQYVDLSIGVKPEMTNYQLQKLVQEQMDAQGPEHIYRIKLEGYRNSLFQADLNGLLNVYHIYDVEDQTHEAYDLEALRKENANNLLGRYIECFDGQEDILHQRALEYGVKALIRCREFEK